MALLGNREWADLRNAMEKHGYAPADFELTEHTCFARFDSPFGARLGLDFTIEAALVGLPKPRLSFVRFGTILLPVSCSLQWRWREPLPRLKHADAREASALGSPVERYRAPSY